MLDTKCKKTTDRAEYPPAPEIIIWYEIQIVMCMCQWWNGIAGSVIAIPVVFFKLCIFFMLVNIICKDTINCKLLLSFFLYFYFLSVD